MSPRAAAVAVALASALLAAPARGATQDVGMGYSTFTPFTTQAVVGDTVAWRNASLREHTVVLGTVDSGKIPPRAGYSLAFPVAGTFRYFCRLHLGMTGQVDVSPLQLTPPRAPVSPGPLALAGRAQPGVREVVLERDDGGGFRPVATARVQGDGAFSASVPARSTARYRARSDALESPPVQVVVIGQRVALAARPGRRSVTLSARTLPERPRGTVVLQLRLRERFGWWPVRTARLDRRGRASLILRLRGPLRARLVLTEGDGATPMATSKAVRIAPRRG